MDWRAHVRSALDGDHPVAGRGIVFLLHGLIGFSAISIGDDLEKDEIDEDPSADRPRDGKH